MTADRELRDSILSLVQLCKRYQVRALSLNSALTVLMLAPPTKRESLKADDIDAEIRKARDQAQNAAVLYGIINVGGYAFSSAGCFLLDSCNAILH
jgi:hypothetical protein